MPWYRCSIAGENFPGHIIGKSTPIGFYTTRFVEASSLDEAETKALANLKNEYAFSFPPSFDRPSAAKIFFESIVDVERPEVGETNLGFSFFVMGT